jgi:hypothetical protein
MNAPQIQIESNTGDSKTIDHLRAALATKKN